MRRQDKAKNMKRANMLFEQRCNEKLSIINESWTDWQKGKGLKQIVQLSKESPDKIFLITDDNYSNIGTYWLKNGKFAKQTVANAHYDFQHNKTSMRNRSDVLYKFKFEQ